MTHDARRRPHVVVGVDGSEPSARALRWALGQAAATGATVEAVSAWEVPVGYGFPPALFSGEDLAAATGVALQKIVTDAAADHPDVPVERRVQHGHPATVLLDRSKQADLLVVGSHGHGGFVSALLGSVSQHCIHHAHCPVVVVRGEDRPDPA